MVIVPKELGLGIVPVTVTVAGVVSNEVEFEVIEKPERPEKPEWPDRPKPEDPDKPEDPPEDPEKPEGDAKRPRHGGW